MPDTMSDSATLARDLRALLAEDRLRDALDGLLAQPSPALPPNDLLLLKSQLADLERDALLRTETSENLDIRRNRLRESLLHCADQLETPQPPARRHEAWLVLQKHAFRLLLTGKVLLLLFIAFHFHISAFSQGETLTLLGLLCPVLVGYLLTAMQGRSTPANTPANPANLTFLRSLVYIGLPLYFWTILWIMLKVPLDEWTFETARNWIAGIEVAFGGLVAYLVKTLFVET